MSRLLPLFVLLRAAQQAAEDLLSRINHRYAREAGRLAQAARTLDLSPSDLGRTVSYSDDWYRFGRVSGWIIVGTELAFLGAGGLGFVERWALALAARLGLGATGTGLLFFGILGLATGILSLPFELHATFVIEERHGFNRQTLAGFFADKLKALGIGGLLGGTLLAALLWLMQRAGTRWWLWAWGAVTGFGVLTTWLYPTLLAPLFNTFDPLPDGELKERILALARQAGFRAGGIFVMDASRRTAHGNAYFTGLFRDKRIVLFDTLVDSLAPREIVAVLAHELGHFQLRHVRRRLLRATMVTGVLLLTLGGWRSLPAVQVAFGLGGPSPWGALATFGLWLGLAEFLLQPLRNQLSRREELAADAFALRSAGSPQDLGDALLKLREKSRSMPVSHPLFSRVYHSHPPLLERLAAMAYRAEARA